VVMDLYEYTRLTIRCCRSDSAPTARALRMADGEMATVIRAMAFRDDGRSLAVLSNDQKVNVYEVPGGTLQAVIPLTSPGVDISFNASGTKLSIWTRQRSEIVYREEIMGTGDLMKAGCEMVRRNMSQEAWKRYFPDQPMQGNV
jgi:hypothetical protein